jgi:GDP-4-dehydro-6-deoxy-D-mannose reductase
MEALRRFPDAEILGIGRSARSGKHFTHDLQWLDGRVAAPLPAELREIDGRYDYAAVDASDPTALRPLIASLRPDLVLHLAASLRDDPWDHLVRSNIMTVVALIEELGRSGVDNPCLVLGSSGSVYGVPVNAEAPFDETTACQPLDPYAVTKYATEHAARVAAFGRNIRVVTARLFNLTGPGLQDRHLCAVLARQVAMIQLGLAAPQIRVGPLGATRDFIDVRDAARAMVILGDAPAGIYNVGSGEETAANIILETLLELSGLTGMVERVDLPGRAADCPRLCGTVGRAHGQGFTAQIGLRRSLSDMLEYYRREVASPQAPTGSSSEP